MHYKDILENLTNLNFDKPNEYLKNFATTSNLDLKNENVQKEFYKLRDDYIKKVDDFYERNFGKNELNKMINPNSKQKKNNNSEDNIKNAKNNLNESNRTNISNNSNKNKKQLNKNDTSNENSNNQNKEWSLYLIGIILLSFMLCYYIFIELWNGLKKHARRNNDDL